MFTRSKRIHDIMINPLGNACSILPCSTKVKLRRMTIQCGIDNNREFTAAGIVFKNPRFKRFHRLIWQTRCRREPLKG